MKFRIISDLHVDINHKYYSKFKFDPEAYYLIAGDIAGSRHKATDFLKYNMKKGGLTENQVQEIIDHFVMKLRIIKFARIASYNEIFGGDPV